MKCSANLRTCARTLVGLGLRVAVAAVVGMLLLVAAYALPREPMRQNVAESASIIAEEGTYPSLCPWYFSMLDNYTDSIMLLEAESDAEDTVLRQALLASRGRIDKLFPNETLTAHFIEGRDYTSVVRYPRYWHGYHVYLNPLLTFLNLGQIRILNCICQPLVTLLVAAMMYRRRLKRLILPYLLSYLLLAPHALAMSLQFYPCFYIYSAGCAAVLARRNSVSSHRQWIYLFAWLGIATSYFDFLTYPIVTFGIPAAVWLAGQDDAPPREILPRLASLLVGWGIGYVGMWACKWILSGAITGINVLSDAGSAITKQTARESLLFPLRVVSKNISRFLHSPAILPAGLYVLASAFLALRKSSGSLPSLFRSAVPWLLLALLPIVWYVGASAHSNVHYWFTHKACAVSAFAGMAMFAQLRHLRRVREK